MLLYIYNVYVRIKRELDYLWCKKFSVSLKVIYVAYIAQVIFRNVAYYRHEQRDTLKDIGFEMIGEMNEDDKWIAEIMFNVLHIFLAVFLVMPWFLSYGHSNHIMGVKMAERFLDCMVIGHTLRFLTYTSTSLPGPAIHCRLGTELNTLSFEDIFTRKASGDDPNCGDLIFSGHMFQEIMISILITSNIKKVLSNEFFNIIIVFAVWSLTIIQAPFIVAARNHYSVDIVVASYLAPLVWIAFEYYETKPNNNDPILGFDAL